MDPPVSSSCNEKCYAPGTRPCAVRKVPYRYGSGASLRRLLQAATLSIFGISAFPPSALQLTGLRAASLILLMRFICAFALLLGVGSVAGADNDPGKYPVALNSDFGFRKAKIYTMSQNPYVRGQRTPAPADTSKKGLSSSRSVDQEVSLNFERSYRLYGAVTALDRRQRFGQYFDFFWRAKRPSDVTVRFEYKQEKLKAFVQAKEQTYQNVDGTNRSEFRVIGDEYFDDGQVLAWRCLLIEHGRIVAEKRSFLWDKSV
jgi:hypothetical protein